MLRDDRGAGAGGFRRWLRKTFNDWWFRSMIGPAQTTNAVHGADQQAREQWKRDLAKRKRFTREQREQRERTRLAREAEHDL